MYLTSVHARSEASTNGTGKDITYDALGRTVTYKETGADGKWLQKTYTYSQGRIATTLYTTQGGDITTETNIYQNGYLKQTTLTGGQVIYNLQEENVQGSATILNQETGLSDWWGVTMGNYINTINRLKRSGSPGSRSIIIKGTDGRITIINLP